MIKYINELEVSKLRGDMMVEKRFNYDWKTGRFKDTQSNSMATSNMRVLETQINSACQKYEKQIQKLEKENEQLKSENELLSEELEQCKAVIEKRWSEYLRKKENDEV